MEKINDKIVWSELISTSHLRNIGVLTNRKQEFDVAIEKYWIEGISKLYLSNIAKTKECREEYLVESMKSLQFYSVICPIDKTYHLFIKDFIKVIPHDEIESFIASLLLDNNIRLEFIVELVEGEIMMRSYHDDDDKQEKRLHVLRQVLNMLKTTCSIIDIDDFIHALIFGKEKCNVLKISILMNGRFNDNESKIHSLSNLIQYINEIPSHDCNEEEILCNTLKVLTFEMIRPIMIILSNIQSYPHSISTIITSIINNTITGLESDEKKLIVFSIYASKIEQLYPNIPKKEKMSLCFALSDIYSRLAEIDHQSLYIQKRDFYVNAYSQFHSDDDSDHEYNS